jgi:thioredoxin 2
MNSIIVACGRCGAKNRIPADKQHLKPACGRCHEKLALREAAVVALDDATFAGFIARASLPVLVEFFSPTCPHCRGLAPVIARLASRYYGRLIVAALDTGRSPQSALRFHVTGVPTLIFFKNGLEKERISGAPGEAALDQRIRAFL